MLSAIILTMFFGVIALIYWGFWYGTRQKLKDEEKKHNFLDSKFTYLNGYEFDKNTIPDNSEYKNLLIVFKNNGFKKGKIDNIWSSLPHSDKKPWKVYIKIKSGTWPFNDKEESIEIYSILDSDLENLEEYKNFTL